jgi:hypothetical protein
MIENTNEEYIEDPANFKPESPSEEITPINETENMEVHHHPHVEKKNFKEYLLEGLMIFLAVSMGFIAENIREYFVDNERENQYIEALVRDLKSDTASFNRAIPADLKREKLMDSLLVVSNLDLTINANAKQLVGLFMGITGLAIHYPSSIAFTQLKSTGSFRLFNHKKGAVDSILRYDLENERMVNYGNFYRNEFELMWETFYPICDVKIFRDTSYAFFTTNKKALKDIPIPPLHLSQVKLSLFTGHITRQIRYNEGYLTRMEMQRQRAIELIDFLQKEYHLKNE